MIPFCIYRACFYTTNNTMGMSSGFCHGFESPTGWWNIRDLQWAQTIVWIHRGYLDLYLTSRFGRLCHTNCTSDELCVSSRTTTWAYRSVMNTFFPLNLQYIFVLLTWSSQLRSIRSLTEPWPDVVVMVSDVDMFFLELAIFSSCDRNVDLPCMQWREEQK